MKIEEKDAMCGLLNETKRQQNHRLPCRERMIQVVLQRSCFQDEDRTHSFINFNDVLTLKIAKAFIDPPITHP
jgi:hypothetical protein